MSAGDVVNLVEGPPPVDYHCNCKYCSLSLGELRPPDGGYYSRLERRGYYDRLESGRDGHVAKTPLHVARWAIQRYTVPGEWVLDPTIGAGTTAVEALTQGRNVAGMEVQYAEVLRANVEKNRRDGVTSKIRIGDARRIGAFLDEIDVTFDLVVSNPPYSGDETPRPPNIQKGETTHQYKNDLPNLAFLREGPDYWEAMTAIYLDCVRHLAPGGHLVTGIKDMIRARKPMMLHERFCDIIVRDVGLTFVGTAFLLHYPRTFHLNRYHKTYGVHPPYYQTINVFCNNI